MLPIDQAFPASAVTTQSVTAKRNDSTAERERSQLDIDHRLDDN
ncbi:hypothetical protein RBSH_00363 [Rhodopirellula baltica SH28]|uniref:Uncharacterized protein n=1 Tax=Rhodopirellula baltica SH28 TaxID=993517 RepID=K5EEN2_RHOBT|nr:hypothetical protein RBSH_00363 [Rhodopirellula baltica SH28]